MSFWQTVKRDILAVRKNDPATHSELEAILAHTPLHAILFHRLIHPLFNAGIPILPRILSNFNSFLTGIEIHTGAKIGPGFFVDHGAGIVIGETAEIGADCVLFHKVTLGGTGHLKGKRHPTVGDRVFLGTGATLLGPITVGDDVRIGAETVIINRDVPSHCTVVGAPGRIVKRDGQRTDEALRISDYHVIRRAEEEKLAPDYEI
jgi:serine O-acetyltransferase